LTTTTLAFLDLETTGLDPERHHIWEIGAIVRGHREAKFNGEWNIQMRPRLDAADPMALRISRYYERRHLVLKDHQTEAFVIDRPAYQKLTGGAGGRWYECNRMHVAGIVAEMLDGAQLIGCVPSFDAAFLTQFLRRHWQAPTWHYHLIDVEQLAVGWLAGYQSGYNNSVKFLAEWHNNGGETGAAVCDWQAQVPRDDTPAPPPPWSSDSISRRLGVEPPGEDERHTALGDARWAAAIWDRVMGTALAPAGGGPPPAD
jgi:DNA polymerase III epsilon subunit-like protein